MISAMITGALKRWVQAVQEFTFLLVDSLRHAFTPPRYLVDTLMQMDVIGFGSLPIVLLIGFFTGGVLALQSYRTLSTFGEVGLMGKVVALSLVLELGPVLTALMMAGRNSTGIASEIGSMVVSEQVDAMRALGTDPLRKLVIPRLVGHGGDVAPPDDPGGFLRHVGRLLRQLFHGSLDHGRVLDLGLPGADVS